MRLSGQFQYFYEKFLSAQKRKSSKNQPTKQRQADKKQQKQRFFAHKNFKRGGEIVCFEFLKKIQIVLITSFTKLLNYVV